MSLAFGRDSRSLRTMKTCIAAVFLLSVLVVGMQSVSDGADASSDGVCTLTFEFGTYSVNFEVPTGSVIEPPPMVPVKPMEDGIVYTFVGWSGYTEGMVATGDKVFTAVFRGDNTHAVSVEYSDGTSDVLYIADGSAVSGDRDVYKYFLDPEMTVEWSKRKAVTSDIVLYAAVGGNGCAGEDVLWSYDHGDRVLRITGSGNMASWASASEVPWSLYSAGVEKVVVSEGVTSVGDNAFRGCSVLFDVVIADSVTSIGKYAFYHDYAIERVVFGSSLASVGKNAFGGLSMMYSDGSVAQASLYAGCVFEGSLKTLVCHKVTVPLTSTLTWSLDFDNGSFTVSGEGDMPDYASTTVMPWYKVRKSIVSVTVEDGVTHIGAKTFPDFTTLEKVHIGDGVVSIGTYAFRKCTSLTEVYVGSSLESLGSVVFTNRFCNPDGSGIVIDASNLAGKTFRNVGGDLMLSEIRGTVGDVLWRIDTVSGSLVVYGQGSTGDCANVKAVPWYQYRSFIEDVVVSDGVTYLTSYAFYSYSHVRSVALSDTVAGIGTNSLRGCDGLKTIGFGVSLSTIGSNALMGLVFHGSDGKTLKTTAANLAGKTFTGGPKEFYLSGNVTVTFVAEDTVVDTVTVVKGSPVTAPVAPAKPSEGKISYMFVGWSSSPSVLVEVDLTSVTEDMVLYAVYKAVGGDGRYKDVRVFVQDAKGEFLEAVVSADSLRDLMDTALLSLGMGRAVMSIDGSSIVSIDGREAGYSQYWVVHQWLPLGSSGWALSTFDGDGDMKLISECALCIHTSSIEFDSKGRQFYSVPDFTPMSYGYVFIRFHNDYDSDEPEVQNAFTEDIRKEGFWLKGYGSNLGEVLVDALESNSFAINYYSGEDSGGNNLQYWIESMFGLGDVLLDDESWKYWIQFCYVDGGWGFNAWTLGYYDPGVYPYLMLVYAISDVNGEELDIGEYPDVDDVEHKVITN
ncbi:MAG: leucine-rich repeat domain-containing protein [archaeon]|nr:leucine-rich repeat domain-containing protein [archaeon]